MVHQHFVERM